MWVLKFGEFAAGDAACRDGVEEERNVQLSVRRECLGRGRSFGVKV